MARTINLEERAIRRDAFIASASRLIQVKGYERMSIQDVLDDLEASRGAFYHYFPSKEALLEAVIERMGDAVIASLGPLVDDPAITAPRKLELLFATIGSYKAEQRELVLAILEVWLSDDNAIVREKFRRYGVTRLSPLLASIIRQGSREGSMSVDEPNDPDDTARVVISLVQGLNELAGELFVAHQADHASIEAIMRSFGAYKAAIERILGLPHDSLTLLDEARLRWWFD